MKGTKLDFYWANIRQKLGLFIKKPSFIGFYIGRARKYASLDQFGYIIVSYPKSGRTWLQKMIIEAICLERGIKEKINDITELSEMADLPLILSTHAGSSWEEHIQDENTVSVDDWSKYSHAKVVFLYRDPRDILVSQYHHIVNRTGYMTFHKDYVIDNKNVGLLKIINFMNKWLKNSDAHSDKIMSLSYETMRQDTETDLARLFEFWDISVSPENIKQAIENCTLDKMRQKEKENADSPWMVTKKGAGSNAFHSRKGMIGEYLEFFSEDQVDQINDKINGKLDARFGYDKI